MLRKANNVYSVLLDNVAVTSGVPSALTVITDANLPKGAIVAVDLGMKRITTIPANSDFMIVQGKGAGVPLMKSPILNSGRIAITKQKFVAAVQQVTYVGYNLTTSTGALSASNLTDYWIKIRKRDNDAANRSQPMSLFAGPIRTSSSASQAEVAFALMKNGLKNFAQEPANGYLKFEVVSNGTVTAAGANATVVNGSKTVTFASNVTIATGAFLAIAGTTYQVATGVTAGTTITLNLPYQGASATVTSGTAYLTNVGTVAATNFGVRLTGVEAPFNVNTFRDYYANRFTVTFSDPSVPVKSDGASDGTGVWQKVAMDEYMNYGFEGENNQLAVPSIPRDQEVKTPASYAANLCTYSAINISWEETINGLVSRDGGKGNVLIYLNLNASGDLATTGSSGEALADTLGAIASPTFTAANLDA